MAKADYRSGELEGKIRRAGSNRARSSDPAGLSPERRAALTVFPSRARSQGRRLVPLDGAAWQASGRMVRRVGRDVVMADVEIVALRAKLASRPRSDDYRQRRRDIDARGLQYGVAPDVKVEPVTANGVRAEWTSTPRDNSDAALLYLHGGGYVIGSLYIAPPAPGC